MAPRRLPPPTGLSRTRLPRAGGWSAVCESPSAHLFVTNGVDQHALVDQRHVAALLGDGGRRIRHGPALGLLYMGLLVALGEGAELIPPGIRRPSAGQIGKATGREKGC